MPRPAIRSHFQKENPEVADLHGAIRKKALGFLKAKGDELVLDVIWTYFSGRKGKIGLDPGSGKSRNSWKSKVRQISSGAGDAGELNITSVLPADFQVKRTIKPTGGRKYLAIPLAPVLKPDGSRKFEGPRSTRVPKNIMVYKTKGGTLFLAPVKVMGKMRKMIGDPWWILNSQMGICQIFTTRLRSLTDRLATKKIIWC